VLDVGCGNARFGRFLAQSLGSSAFHYVGHDSSRELLTAARSNLSDLGCTFELHSTNLLGADYRGCPELHAENGTFDLVAGFGVFHHIPAPLQAALLRRCLAATRAPGSAWFSFWQFGREQRFEQRRLPWSWAIDRDYLTKHQIAELDHSDWLLPWGNQNQDLARYCRYTTNHSAGALLSNLPGLNTEFFFADGNSGRLNFYAQCRKTS